MTEFEKDRMLADHYKKLYYKQMEEKKEDLIAIRNLKDQVGRLYAEKAELLKVAEHYQNSPVWKMLAPLRFIWKKIKLVKIGRAHV